VSLVITLSCPYVPARVVFPKAPFSATAFHHVQFVFLSPCLWNELSSFPHQPHSSLSLACLFMLLPVFYHIFSLCQLTALPPLTPSFAPGSKPISFTNLSSHRLSPGLRTDYTDFMTGPFLLSILAFLVPSLPVLFGSVWIFVIFLAHVNIVYHIMYQWSARPRKRAVTIKTQGSFTSCANQRQTCFRRRNTYSHSRPT